MNRFTLSAGVVFTLAVAVTVGLLAFVADRSTDARRHAAALAVFDGLVQTETSLDRDLLQVVAGILPHYDPLVEHVRGLETLAARLPAGDAGTAVLYRARIDAKLDAAERIKGTAAFVRNAVNYVPFRIGRYGETGRPEVLARMQRALIDELAGRPSDAGGAVAVPAAPADGPEAAELAHIALHLGTLRDQKAELRDAIDAYFAIDARGVLETLRTAYLADYARRQWWSQAITLVLVGLTFLLFVALGGSIVRLGRAHRRVRESEAKFSTIFHAAPEPVAIAAVPDGTLLDVNAAFERVTGFTRGEALGRPLQDFAADDEVRGLAAALTGPAPLANREMRLRRREGPEFTALVSLEAARIGRSACCIAVARDITDRIAAEHGMRMADSVFENAREGIMITDAGGTIERINPAFTRITGYAPDDVIGASPRLLNSGRHDRAFYRDLWAALIRDGHWSGEIWNRRRNGEIYPEWLSISAVRDREGRTGRYVAVFSDITTVKRHEAALQHLAHHDALTGLPNRVLLADRMEQAMARTRRSGRAMAVAYLDLDGFKPVNDRHGHGAGDALLVEVARRMAGVLRTGDTLARPGGDEFVILLPDLGDAQECAGVLGRVLAAVSEPVSLPDVGTPVRVSASIGVSLFPDDDSNPDTLLRHADQAMYQAKQAGRNRFQFYDADRDQRVQARRETVAALRAAIGAGRFTLFYQPKVNMRLGSVVGAEALIRWNHPERGLLSPGEFLPLIEETELEVALGEWVIATALAQMADWHRRGIDLTVSVNIAARHLLRADFTDRLTALLAAHPELPRHRLQLEVLETAALEDIGRARTILHVCREMGVSAALDDFGTGYSSLTYLRHLPVQTLKIDQSFVRNLPHDAEDCAIVESVIVLARALGRTVLAEGVESVEQGRRLLHLGCDLAQGYCIARPMPAADLPDWIRTWQADPRWTADDRPDRLAG
ncbi:EAL domain-containing protein [Azospirillum halopraeferens]|uniref:EAL domain-containing protein n=1 Tax=Azospirillum halopraeferens TaxID=34010 RepID=UPI000415D3F7|nr:EAL domain-containing protein [Azospirillum halopraeferens]